MATFPAPYNLPARKTSPGGDILRGLLLGLLPLLLLVILVAATLVLTAFMRQQFATAGFFAQQQADLITLIAGLVVALLVYVVSLVLVFRGIKAWQQGDANLRATVALWMLVLTALIVVLPVVVALVLPQHPAP